MSGSTERVVAAYDVGSDARRRRMARVLEGYGVRVQGSVFEAVLHGDAVAALWAKLCRAADASRDRLLLQPLCARCHERARHLGMRPSVNAPSRVRSI